MDQQPLKVKVLEIPSSLGLWPCLESPVPGCPYLVDLPADLPNSPHQELLQVAALSAWPPIFPNQAPRKETQNGSGEKIVGKGHGSWAKRNHEKEVGWTKESKHDGKWERWNSQWQFWKPRLHACLTSLHMGTTLRLLPYSSPFITGRSEMVSKSLGSGFWAWTPVRNTCPLGS